MMPPLARQPSVYMDLNHWIGLAKAGVGHHDSGAYAEALPILRDWAERGRATFPLSIQHYAEIANITDVRQRNDIALVMGKISQYTALAPRDVLLRHELRNSLSIALG